MKCEWKIGLGMLAILCWAPIAAAETAASGVAATAASGVPATDGKKIPTAEEFYKEAQETWKNGEVMETMLLYKLAADRGHEQAMMEVATLYLNTLNLRNAFVYFSKAANLGNTEALVHLALILEGGQDAELPLDHLEARKLLMVAAEKGNKTAVVYMAAGYINGGWGLTKVERNSPQALDWVRRAADIDDVLATRTLVTAYQKGLYGLAPDPVEADNWNAKLTELQNRGTKKEVKKTSKKQRR